MHPCPYGTGGEQEEKAKISSNLKILETYYDNNMRCLKFTMYNNNNLEGELLFKGIYENLMSNEDLINFGFLLLLSEHRRARGEDYYLCVSNELSNYNNLQYGYHNEEIINYKYCLKFK
jgi:hypothetical protein